MNRPLEIAIVIDPTKPYDRRVVGGVANYVNSKSLDWSLYVELDPAHILPDPDAWAGDGILANFDNRRVAQAVSNLGIPVVGIGGGYGYYRPDTSIPYVRTDNEAISELAAHHLMDLGLRHFAFCSERHNRSNGWALERQKAFWEVVTNAGFDCKVFNSRHAAARDWKGLQKALQKWLGTLQYPVGIMASNDGQARHILQACHACGIRVPDDVAVVGVDNDHIMCELSRPPLTSIEQGARSVGYQAAAVLSSLITGEKPPHTTAAAPEHLIERQSTNVLAIGDEDVATAVRFIRQHACDPIHVKDVVRVINVSQSTIETRFRKYLGRSVRAEIRRAQISKAKHLLQTSNLAIKEVVRAVGASSVQYFTAMIRRETGQTPGEIRNDARVFARFESPEGRPKRLGP